MGYVIINLTYVTILATRNVAVGRSNVKTNPMRIILHVTIETENALGVIRFLD